MLKLRKILLSNYFYLGLIIILLIYLIIFFLSPHHSHYDIKQKVVVGIITNYNIDGNKLTINLKAKEKLIGTYYFKSQKEKAIFIKNISIGDKLKLAGTFTKPTINTTEYLFNYNKYLKRQGIYFIINIKELTLLNKNTNLFYLIKDFSFKRTNNPYLRTFILGDNSLLAKNILKNYQELGISHLFAISGMHISLLSTILLKLLTKIDEKAKYLIVSIILLGYLLLVGFLPSVLRAVLFFILFSINKIYYFYIKPVQIYIIVLVISLFINPNYLFAVGFLYSFSISLALIIFGAYINSYKHYFTKLLITSLISFLVSIPITIYNYNQLNILSIFYNLFYVPLISIIIFPLALISFFIKPVTYLLNIFIYILEKSSSILAHISYFKFIFCQSLLVIYILYICLIVIALLGLSKRKYYYTIPVIITLIIHTNYNLFNTKDYLIMFDIGQGDSILLHSNNKNVLVDTGGKMTYNTSKWQVTKNKYSLVEKITIPYLKKRGIKKLDYLILTHGDFDHLGEALTLIQKFKVKKILINEGSLNNLEKQIKKESKNVIVAKQNYYFEAGEFSFFSLNNDLGEENDSSLVFYVTIKNKKILLMGDASYKSEENIMDNFNLDKVDILKVGHHGSRTSSSEKFLKTIKPKLALISAGKDNKFGHPNQEIIDRFQSLDINYLVTNKVGSIKISF